MESHLLHFTGRNKTSETAFAILKAICTNQILWLNPCPIFSGENWEKKVSMACFTDLSRSESERNMTSFGDFSIGFNKKSLTTYGANPVFYTTPVNYAMIQGQLALLAKLEELEKDRCWKKETEEYPFTEDETFSLQAFTGLLQEYAYRKDISKINYEQREWRLVFASLLFAGGGAEQLPGMSGFTIENGKAIATLKFSHDDIDFIVVPKTFAKEGRDLAIKIGKPCTIIT